MMSYDKYLKKVSYHSTTYMLNPILRRLRQEDKGLRPSKTIHIVRSCLNTNKKNKATWAVNLIMG